PRRRISSLRSPTALSSLSPRKELLQTSSARRSVLWTAVGLTGRISISVTRTPQDAACHAASDPARPPPTIVINFSYFLAGPHPRSQVAYAPDLGLCAFPFSVRLCGLLDQLFGPRVVAVFVVANHLTAVLLGDLLDEEGGLALRALLGD